MNRRMTLRAGSKECRLAHLSRPTLLFLFDIGVVCRMAAHAEVRLILFQQIMGNRAVRIMADTTIIADRRMFEDKGALELGVAIVAEIIYRAMDREFLVRCMRIMAAGALHFSLPQRMVGRKIHLRLFFAVAGIAEIDFLCLKQSLFFSFMNLVAAHAAEILCNMNAARPGFRRVIMTGQANGRTLVSGKFPEAEDILCLLVVLYMKTSRAMTGLAAFRRTFYFE